MNKLPTNAQRKRIRTVKLTDKEYKLLSDYYGGKGITKAVKWALNNAETLKP